MSPEPEHKWIRAILRRGDRQAADALVRRYYDELFAFVYRQTGDREDALDLTQDIFVAVLGSLAGYDRKKAAFRTWLYALAAHKVIDHRRRAGPLTVPLEEDVPAEDFTTRLHDRALLARAEELVRQADPLEQEVFRLRLYAGLSFPEIAAAAGQPEAKIKSRYYRLMAKLRKELLSDE